MEILAEIPRAWSTTRLQFGHGYKAVEMAFDSCGVMVRWKLQFGHGYKAVEIALSADPDVLWAQASIRPRL